MGITDLVFSEFRAIMIFEPAQPPMSSPTKSVTPEKKSSRGLRESKPEGIPSPASLSKTSSRGLTLIKLRLRSSTIGSEKPTPLFIDMTLDVKAEPRQSSNTDSSKTGVPALPRPGKTPPASAINNTTSLAAYKRLKPSGRGQRDL